MDTTGVVADVNALVDAAAPGFRRRKFESGTPLPSKENLGALLSWFSSQSLLSLHVSPHILGETARVLKLPRPEGLGVSVEAADAYVSLVGWLAKESGGGWVLEPPPLNVLRDFEDNSILAAAVASKSQLIISADQRLRDITGYEGIAVLPPDEFVKRMDVVQRAARRELERLLPKLRGRAGMKGPGG